MRTYVHTTTFIHASKQELARSDADILSSEIFTAFVSEDNETAAEFLVARKRNNPLERVRWLVGWFVG